MVDSEKTRAALTKRTKWRERGWRGVEEGGGFPLRGPADLEKQKTKAAMMTGGNVDVFA